MTADNIKRLKRQVAHAHSDVIRAVDHLGIVGVEFAEVHPELSDQLLQIAEGLLIANQCLEQFCFEAWGVEQPEFETWANLRVKE